MKHRASETIANYTKIENFQWLRAETERNGQVKE